MREPRSGRTWTYGMATNGWDVWGDWYEASFAPIMEWMCRAARLEPGKRVLDLACGTGQPALRVARLVRPGGRVVATDKDETMLAATSRRAKEAGLQNVEVLSMDMHELRFPDASFDAVTTGFALMFSPDPVKLAAEIRRVLVPGGRIAVAVWDALEKNPFFSTVFGAAAKVDPNASMPNPFRLAPPGALESVLKTAGFSEVTVEPVTFTIESASLDEHWRMLVDMALRSKLEALSQEDVARFRRHFDEALAPFVIDGRVRLGVATLGGAGMK